jgi:hypothetical protein
MPINTWEKLIALPNAEYKFLVHINPSKYLICGTNWTSEGSDTYSISITEVNLNAVTDDGIEMTERATVALVKANAGSWYFDFYNQKLYVRAFDDDDLSGEAEGTYTADASTDEDTLLDTEPTSTTSGYYDGWYLYNESRGEGAIISTSVYAAGWTFNLATDITGQTVGDSYTLKPQATIIMYVWKYHATDNGVYDGYQHKAVVKQNSLPNMDLSVDDIVEGAYKFNFGSFTMMNDGSFDTASDEYLWFNRKVLVYIGGEDLPFSEYALYFVGRISDMFVQDETVNFSVKDIRVGTFSQLPLDHYWQADYPNLRDEDEDKPIPIFYGEKENIIPVMLSPYTASHLRAVADDGGSQTTETTEAGDATEDDMTLLPAVPAVDDAYYFGNNTYPFGRLNLKIGQQGVGTWTIVWEYYNGTTWKDLSEKHDLSDGTDGFTADEDWHQVTFKRPGDWSPNSVNSIAAYWIRARVSEYTDITTQPLGDWCKLEDTKGSEWKLCGHIMNAFLDVRVNDVSTSSYTPDLANGEFTLTAFFDDQSDTIAVDAQGKTVAAAYITKGADIAKDILKSYLPFLDVDLDLQSFTDTNNVRTHPLAIYLDTDTGSRLVLQTVGRSTIAFLTPTEDGKLSFIAYEPTVETGTLELHDADYWADWKVQKDHKFVKRKIIIKFDRNPGTQEFKAVERENADVFKKYGIKAVLSLETYVKNLADATTICKGIRDMCSKPITVAETTFGMKGFKLFPTRKVILNRERAADVTGAFTAKVFRVRSVAKDSSSESTHIVAMDDLQTLGESFCYVCFTCQVCVSEEAACSLCYVCEICVATQGGCQWCDTCQLCVSDQGGCQVCDDCEICVSCEQTVGTCTECQDCVACELCYVCETTVNFCAVCQSCVGCDTCDTCQAFVTCNSCDACQTCNACQVCVSTEDCTSCDWCNTCQVQVTCAKCDTCDHCVSCQNCVDEHVHCPMCEICVSCDDTVSCGSCDVSCQNCVNCQTCATSESCAACDICNTCQGCDNCVNCFTCEGSCYACEICVESEA